MYLHMHRRSAILDSSRGQEGTEPMPTEPTAARLVAIRRARIARESFEDRLRKAGTTDRMLLDTLVGAFELGYKTAIKDLRS